MKKDKRAKSKGKIRRVCGMCKPHKKYPRNKTKVRRQIQKLAEQGILESQDG